MSRVSNMTVIKIKDGNNQEFLKLKQEYEQAIYYIVLRKLRKESYVKECIDEIYSQFLTCASDYNEKQMNLGTWFMIFAKKCADDYARFTSKEVNHVRLANGLVVDIPVVHYYNFEYNFEFGYNNHDLSLILTEEEYAVLYFKTYHKLTIRTIGKLLDLSEFSVNKFHVLAIQKMDRYLLVKEN